MSTLLEKFFAQSRRSRIDRSLVERWEFDARIHGESSIKSQIAQAKRTATVLSKTCTQFSNVKPEQELALKAAVSTLNQLVAELQPLVPWAKDYKEFCESEYKRERKELLESIAVARWGDDQAALQFEFDLVSELDTKEGKRTFADWLHSLKLHEDVPGSNISCCIERPRDHEGATLRERMAAAIEKERRSTNNQWHGVHGPTLICSFATYERYLAFRKMLASSTSGLLKAAFAN